MENSSCIFGNGSCHGNSMAAGQAYDLIDPLYVPYCKMSILFYGCYSTLCAFAPLDGLTSAIAFFFIRVYLNIYHCMRRTWTNYFPMNFFSSYQLFGCCWLQTHGFLIFTWPFAGLHPASDSSGRQFCTSKLYLPRVF